MVGHKFTEYFHGARFERDIADILNGKVGKFPDQEYDLNGFAIVATLTPLLENNDIVGVIVHFRNMQEMKDVTEVEHQLLTKVRCILPKRICEIADLCFIVEALISLVFVARKKRGRLTSLANSLDYD